MGRLIYLVTTSINGYVSDSDGNFDWTAPSQAVLASINDILSNVGSFWLGRKMYQTLKVWDSLPTNGPDKGMNDFAKLWRSAQKVVYSTSLSKVTTVNTTIETSFEVEHLAKVIVESAQDINIGGPHLAAAAIRAGLVDDYLQFIVPVMIGGSNYWLPKNVKAEFKLIQLDQFDNGRVHLHYRKA